MTPSPHAPLRQPAACVPDTRGRAGAEPRRPRAPRGQGLATGVPDCGARPRSSAGGAGEKQAGWARSRPAEGGGLRQGRRGGTGDHSRCPESSDRRRRTLVKRLWRPPGPGDWGCEYARRVQNPPATETKALWRLRLWTVVGTPPDGSVSGGLVARGVVETLRPETPTRPSPTSVPSDRISFLTDALVPPLVRKLYSQGFEGRRQGTCPRLPVPDSQSHGVDRRT